MASVTGGRGRMEGGTGSECVCVCVSVIIYELI